MTVGPRRILGTGACAAVLFAAFAGTAAAEAVRVERPKLERLSVPGGRVEAFVNPTDGAELVGLRFRRGNQWIELLYRGMDFRPTEGWAGRAPILWPAVGRNYPQRADTGALGWTVHGKTHPMPIHGFARDVPWRVIDAGRCSASAFVRLTLEDNEKTRDYYPFGFELTTEYRVWRDSLYIRQRVHSASSNTEAMPFSIGNHITLAIPLVPGSEGDMTLVDTPATQQVMTDSSGRPTGQVVAVDYSKPRRLDTFEPLTALSLSGYPDGPAWVRIVDPSGLAVRIEHSEGQRPAGVPVLFNLWGDARRGYFAPEPWVGKQNSLSSGDGVLRLAPAGDFEWVIVLSVSTSARLPALAASPAPNCH